MAKRSDWRRTLPRRILAGDVLVIALTMVTAHSVRFGMAETRLANAANLPYWVVGVAIGALWLLALWIWRAWEIRVVGSGVLEYRRVVNATLALFGAVAIFSYVFGIELARGYVAVAFPVGMLLLVGWRWASRQVIVRMRQRGRLSRRLVIIGGPGEALQLHRSFARAPSSGFSPYGAILPGRSLQSPDGEELPLPVLSVDRSVPAILEVLLRHEVEVVAVTGGGLSPRLMRALSWELADHSISLILAPALTDIAGPRIHSHPVADLPLIHVSTPRLGGFSAALKRVFDILGAALGLLVISPFMLATAIAIKLDDGGPVFFRQTRVGRENQPFTMIKFRSMVVDAEARLAELEEREGQDAGNGVLFKMKDDPRITRVGRILRAYSIDELPQLINVLLGSMSMVGPRPPLASEVERYGTDVLRRLIVKPGITGLWQVGGRSDLDWEESVRLDLYYVENWSIVQDLIIIFRTVRVVLTRDGAY
ncbi:sugar transferase [Brevibacterium senegalense]|uniref:sugar transferase n=1 Tax=Brevibacterium senegalense TaxID=1033736 RepID=UPI000A04F63F|nr:sugar transferase [Brevibacterium senegalense]